MTATALLKLARNFADPEVGCVTGEARYLSGGHNAADVGERVYWDYEIQIKRLETALGSMVGGDGAIYAIRRPLWRELPSNAINDFLNPLQIVEAGWRGVYEPEAICYEETAGGTRTEYRRRVRIVSRSWRAVFQAAGVLNPLRVGLFTWSLVSHKLLRWLSGAFVALAMISSAILVVPFAEREPWALVSLIAAVAAVLALTPRGRRLTAMAVYFGTIYVASLVGVVKGSFGQVSGIWTTPRLDASAASHRPGLLVPVGLLMHIALAALVAVGFLLYRSRPTGELASMLFWTSSGALAYVYVGYPSLLAVIRLFAGRQVSRADIEPSVCVFITANDEAEIIAAKLHNTLALDYPADRLTVIVASDGSVDATNDVVRGVHAQGGVARIHPAAGKDRGDQRRNAAGDGRHRGVLRRQHFLGTRCGARARAQLRGSERRRGERRRRAVRRAGGSGTFGGFVLPLRTLASARRVGARVDDRRGRRALRHSP